LYSPDGAQEPDRGSILTEIKEERPIAEGTGGAEEARGQAETVGRDAAAATDAIVHKGRKRGGRAGFAAGDISIALGLAGLLPLAWLLPEAAWRPFWQVLSHTPLVTSRRAVARNGASIRRALNHGTAEDIGERRAQAIARALKACVYEIRMQDLRAWRPFGTDAFGGGWRPKLSLEGEAHLKTALAGGKGAVLWVSPTVFNSLPTKIALAEAGHRVSHLSSPNHGFSETAFGVRTLNRIRCIPEDRYLAARVTFDKDAPATAMRRLMRAVKAGEVVSIVAANTEGYEMVEGPIFGGRLPVAVGAPRLAALTGAPLLPVFVVRDENGPYGGLGFRVAIEAPIELPRELKGDARTIAAVAEYLRRSEPWVRQYPEQWRAWSKWKAPKPAQMPVVGPLP
jgi:lauroyl/myristoyl acyltransferase